jgi:cytochrome c553
MNGPWGRLGRYSNTLCKTGGKSWLIMATVLAALVAIGGFLLAVSGIIPIKASSRHWAITKWVLNFAKERSVKTHALGLKTPPLDAPSLVIKGAGHYETGCFPCHGSPELQHPPIAQAMTPTPPHLPLQITKWEPRELFYIVKHGIQFTGMPAWPALQRDDEVWAMVAFLRRLPSLDAAAYRTLVGGPVNSPGESTPLSGIGEPPHVPLTRPADTLSPSDKARARACARCHGADGLGRGPGAFPKLAGQRPEYLLASLKAFKHGKRHSGIMEPIAAELNPESMRQLADYYASLREPVMLAQVAEEAIEQGEAIARRGIPNQRVPACAACHGPSATRRNPIYPVLAGQHADYLALQLQLFKDERRGGTDYSHIMHMVAGPLTSDQMHDVALYYQSLSGGHDSAK